MVCPLEDESQYLLTYAQATLGRTKNATLRSLKVSRTIADLADLETITPAHLAEAFHYSGWSDLSERLPASSLC
ncbi:hypothetical protein KSB_68530 [Ktedonobacter robiniae]|uniref:Mg chelatase-related protein C-terminal domain-containing protein n=2 Tax=Ktedonobacter robiniae TaxID=2778365 RepID=A0ABQ3V038_9CHLR|nr:hypothetical protein KSB_68530 [Ktedonobacter robiniae]